MCDMLHFYDLFQVPLNKDIVDHINNLTGPLRELFREARKWAFDYLMANSEKSIKDW